MSAETEKLQAIRARWQDRAIAFAEAYTAWSRAVIEAMQPIVASLSASLRHDFDLMLPTAISFGRDLRKVQRSYRRDLHRAYRRRYHQRPPLRRASQ